jgi:hypothetical protein
VREVVVDTAALADTLMRKLNERQHYALFKADRMIVIGPDAFDPLRRMEKEFMFTVALRGVASTPQGRRSYDYDLHFFHYKIPVLFLPDFVGIALLPDLTNQVEKITEDEYYRERNNLLAF